MWWIKASIQEYILRSWSLVKIGTTTAQKKLFFNLKKIKNINLDLEKMISNLGRQFLHAKILEFIHPKSGKEMKFTSILPHDLEKIIKTLRKLSK